MRTVLSILGTRPEAIKMAPVIRALEAKPDALESVLCSTGQHREMLDQALRLFDLRPDVELDVMAPDQTLAALTARLFEKLDGVVQATRPAWVLAQGDTTSVLVASLIAYYHRIPFGHVEAGLRTGDRHRPFPEEVNRCVADVVGDLLFAPTPRAQSSLLREGVCPDRIRMTGNTVVDALQMVADRTYDWDVGPLKAVPRDRDLVLVTAHRRESFGSPFEQICRAVRDLADAFGKRGVHFVYPVHLNPRVRKPVQAWLTGAANISLLEPLDYLPLVQLMKAAKLVLTDSGGIQEEAPALGVPVLVLRDTTERPEGVETGVARLVGTDYQRIVSETTKLLGNERELARMAHRENPYGDGRAGQRIVDALLSWSRDG